MSQEDNNPEVEQEQETNEETEDQTTEEETEEQSDDSAELEKLRQENAKLSRLLKKKAKPATISNPIDEQRLERLELRQEGYSTDVIDNIMELGGREALKNPLVKNAVSNLVEQEKTEAASEVTGASQSSTRSNVTIDELKGMSSKEMAKHLPKA